MGQAIPVRAAGEEGSVRHHQLRRRRPRRWHRGGCGRDQFGYRAVLRCEEDTMKRGAFTLIEVMIAVAVLGVLTAAAVLSFASPLREAQYRDAVDLIRAADADARVDAKHFDRRVKLVYDPGHGQFERRDSADTVISRG